VDTCVGGWLLEGGTAGFSVGFSSDEYSSLIAQLQPTSDPTNGSETINCDGALTLFHVNAPGVPAGTAFFTVMVNGSATDLSCFVTSSSDVCESSAVIPVTAGDTVNVQVHPGAVGAGPSDWSAVFLANTGDDPVGP